MNNKKKIVCYLSCSIVLLLFCIFVCERDKITNKIEPSQKKFIEQYFRIGLPEKGNVVFIKNNLNNEYYGGKVLVALELNKSAKREIAEQIKNFEKIDVTEEDEELFGFHKKDIKKAGEWLVGTVERFDDNIPCPFTASITVFVRQHKGKIYLYLKYSEGF